MFSPGEGPDAGLRELRASLKEELYLALLGYGGSVFRIEPASERGPNAKLSSDLSWLTATDRKAAEDLICLGSYYQTLMAYNSSQRNLLKAHSAAQQALGEGLTEVLHLYREAILEIQQRGRLDTSLHVVALQVYLQRFRILLPALALLVQCVTKADLRGSHVLHALANLARRSTGEVAACTTRLQWHCLQPVRKHVLAWMLHGELLNARGEFFIRCLKDDAQQQSRPGGAGMGAHQDQRKWRNFRVDEKALPPGLTAEVAQGILFVGQVAWLGRKAASRGSALAPVNSTASWGRDSADAIADVLRADVFDAPRLGRCVAVARAQAARVLWGMLVKEGDLHAHLAALKSYFLAGSGDFLTAFLLQARRVMDSQQPLGSSTQALLRDCWQRARAASSASEDPLLDRFELVLDGHEADKQDAALWERRQLQVAGAEREPLPALYPPKYDAWDALRLQYNVQEPLDQVVPNLVLRKYNAMWQLLVRLKRADMGLREAWLLLKRRHTRSRREPREAGAAARLLPLPELQAGLWRRHHCLTHILASLLSYLQMDVVESQSALFRHRLASMDSLDAAQRAHAQYVDATAAQAFLDEPRVMAALSGVLAQCRRLCALIQFWRESDPPAAGGDGEHPAVDQALHDLLEALKQLQGVSRSRAPSLGTLLASLELCGGQDEGLG